MLVKSVGQVMMKHRIHSGKKYAGKQKLWTVAVVMCMVRTYQKNSKQCST